MKKCNKTPRFEVSAQERMQQSRHAQCSVRLPKLGYALYRVYGKSSHPKFYRVKTQNGVIVFDSMFEKAYTPFKVKWLKPKHVTFLKMQNIRVEPAEPGDKGTRVGP